jgi:hypothetical protein
MTALQTRIDNAVLDRVVEAAHQLGARGVVVFDLDSTLLDNRVRQAQILREYGVRAGLGILAQTRSQHFTSWDIGEAMRAVGCTPEQIAMHAGPAKDYWRSVFFTSAYCAVDDAIPGAQGYVKRLVNAGTQIAYCTGRHEEMRVGTVQSFERLGFPVPGPGVSLLMKPTFDQSDDGWKEEAYARLKELGTVVACFDNEPTHINGYASHFLDAICVHLDTDHSGRPVTLADRIVSVKRFAEEARAQSRV